MNVLTLKSINQSFKCLLTNCSLLQSLNEQEKIMHCDFCIELEDIEDEDGFIEQLIFRDESAVSCSNRIHVFLYQTEHFQ